MSDQPLQTLADKIDWLFKTRPHPDGREYTYQEVEAGTTALGYPVTGAYVWKLRKGKADMPNWLILRSLGRFFNIPISFFYDEDLTHARLLRLEVETALERRGVEEIALRASHLDESSRDAILGMINHILTLQQPPPASASDDAMLPPEDESTNHEGER
jgi:hypothetical protein